MENLLQNIACGLWIALGVYYFFGLKKWNKRFSDLYDELKHETGEVHGRWVTHYRSGTPVAEGYVSTCCDMWNNRKSNYCPHCGAIMDGGNS